MTNLRPYRIAFYYHKHEYKTIKYSRETYSLPPINLSRSIYHKPMIILNQSQIHWNTIFHIRSLLRNIRSITKNTKSEQN
jgi:hypothetical protein